MIGMRNNSIYFELSGPRQHARQDGVTQHEAMIQRPQHVQAGQCQNDPGQPDMDIAGGAPKRRALCQPRADAFIQPSTGVTNSSRYSAPWVTLELRSCQPGKFVGGGGAGWVSRQIRRSAMTRMISTPSDR
jgi:hypothetical protein